MKHYANDPVTKFNFDKRYRTMLKRIAVQLVNRG